MVHSTEKAFTEKLHAAWSKLSSVLIPLHFSTTRLSIPPYEARSSWFMVMACFLPRRSIIWGHLEEIHNRSMQTLYTCSSGPDTWFCSVVRRGYIPQMLMFLFGSLHVCWISYHGGRFKYSTPGKLKSCLFQLINPHVMILMEGSLIGKSKDWIHQPVWHPWTRFMAALFMAAPVTFLTFHAHVEIFL